MKNVLSILTLFFSLTVYSQLQRIEPPFWWADMHTHQVELLLYGKNISQYQVVSQDISIIKAIRLENPNYLFVTIETKNLSPGKYYLDFQLNGKTKFSHTYELKQRESHSAERKGFDASDVIYLIMPDRFANGNPNNDNTNDTFEKTNRNFIGGRHGGDIQGIINHLDYLEDLGITAIWSTPLLEDNEPVYSYHTYAQSDYYRIDPRFGTNEEYRQLSKEMQKRGMKLIKDYVTNHWGISNWIIQDLPDNNWIHIWEDGTENGFKRSNYRMTTQFDHNASQTDAKGCMNGWFDNTMPDINQRHPQVLNYMVQNAIWWIEFAELGGLRVDTYSYNDKEGIAQWTKAVMDEYPNFNIVGEVWYHNQAEIAYWQKDSPLAALQNYNSHLPSVMDFTLHNAIMEMFNEPDGWDTGMYRAYNNFAKDFLYTDINNVMIFGGNHDTDRINHLLGNDIDKYRLFITFLATVRGFPQLYYGDEIGMTGSKYPNGDGDVRHDFPGGWATDTQNAFTQNGRTHIQESYYSFTKKVLNYRKKTPALHFGKFLHYIPKNQVYVYFRMTEVQTVMVILNNSNKEQILDLEHFNEGIQNHKQGFDVLNDKSISLEKELKISAKTPMIIELRNDR